MTKPELIYSRKLPFGRFETWNGPLEKEIWRVHQVHGNDVVENPSCEVKADGIFVLRENFQKAKDLLIVTADCLPVVIGGEHGVAFIHAGWRGLAAHILTQNEVRKISPKWAFIGPHIGPEAFEVGQEFPQNFPDSPHFTKKGYQLFFNLGAEAIDRLKKDFPGIEVEHSGLCTYQDLRFHSHRRDANGKRNWNLFVFQD